MFNPQLGYPQFSPVVIRSKSDKMGSIETAVSTPELSFEKFHNVLGNGLRGSEKMHQGVNPSDKSLLWDVPIATERDLDEAVEVAREAFKSWSKTSWTERQEVMGRMRDELQKHIPEMAKLLSLEGGKPVSSVVKIDVNCTEWRDRYNLRPARSWQPSVHWIGIVSCRYL